MANVRISRDYRLLYRVPKDATIDFLLGKSEASVLRAVRLINSSPSGALRPLLAGMQYREVIYVFEKCGEATPEDALELFRQYRYRGMKTLYLYTYKDSGGGGPLNEAALNRVLADKTDALNTGSSRRFSQLKIRDIEAIKKGTIVELAYTYHGFIPYIPPETGCPETVADLRRGFVWISKGSSWICICAKDENVTHVLLHSLEEHLGLASKPLPLTKTVQRRMENVESIRKAGFLNPVTGTRRRTTNPHMVDDPDAMQEFRQRDHSDDRPLSSFNVDLGDGTSFALSYNENGRIYLSRDLTVGQMREWGIGKIHRIVEVVNTLRLRQPAELLGDKLLALRGAPKKAREPILQVASAIIRCKKENIADSPLETGILELAESLKEYVTPHFRCYCRDCDDNTELVCDCNSMSFVVKDGRVHCSSCASAMGKQVRCSEGHGITIRQVCDCVELLPLSKLSEIVKEATREAADLELNLSEEGFSIRNMRLHYTSNLVKTVYRLQEIPDFHQLLPDVPVAL